MRTIETMDENTESYTDIPEMTELSDVDQEDDFVPTEPFRRTNNRGVAVVE